MSDGLYSSFAEVLSVCQSIKEDLAAVLDPETGYAPRMRQICCEQVEELEDSPDSRNLRREVDLLRLESNTWGLLQAVMPARKTDPPQTRSPRELLLENPYTPTSTLAQAIMDASPLLAELVVVREWLHDTAPTLAPPEANTGYWKFTKHTIMQGLRTGHGQRDGLVSEMDPDAVNRGDGAGLAADDASYEKSLLQALYGYVRAGRLDDAVEVCQRAHQPWRAASIRGSLLFQWKALSTELTNGEEDNGDGEPEIWSGNRNRKLWKATCVRAASSTNLSDQERLLYASLAPSPQTASLLKSASRTWEDHLWAEISVICEEKESMELGKLAAGSFWEGGVDAVEKTAQDLPRWIQKEHEEAWEKEVVRTLEGLQGVAVLDGPPADHAFHFTQLLIILDRTSVLLESFSNGLQDGTHSKLDSEYGSMCRFFAHLCLFLQMIDTPVPPAVTQVILESYLEVLEEAGERELIVLYAGALGDNAVERYAAFLVSLALSANYDERRLALTRASEHGLDVERVAVAAAERTIEKAFLVLGQLQDPLPSIIAFQPPANESETFLLRSIEWTTFMESTYNVALEQATVILRYFLGAGRVQNAQSLLALLPNELASIAEPEEIATEYLHYRQFFVIWDTLARVVDCQSQESSYAQSSSRDARNAWLGEYRNLIDQAYDQIIKLLTTEWLVSDVENAGGDRRRRELIRIRQIFVPELILRLHYILHSSRNLIPENLKRALELANIVADSRYKLYEDFMSEGGRTLAEYLGTVRQAILAGLEHGGSDPFRIVTGP
ncbi:unnamed protein product [Cyclocybe aegerita]|uniref:Nuclear pore complex protein n=1 Tax=Cyclocybe aegerita TaxID=1973307 RepID=A0A8S0WKA1_CYCAE|nr:unnamed protein product [Cyclocybe aegerita]